MARAWTNDIAKLRRFRALPARDVGIADAVERLTSEARKQHRAANALGLAWKELVPPHLAQASAVQRLTPAGILTIKVDDAAARYELDRWLRGVGEVLIKMRSTKTVRTIRLV